MAYEEILTETRDRVGIIRFNRPTRLNAFTSLLAEELQDQMTKWNSDDQIGAIVLTGEGRGFMAGADVQNFAERVQSTNKPTDSGIVTGGGTSLTGFMQRSKPTIAAVNGYAVGVGLTLILPCDVRIASTEAIVEYPLRQNGSDARTWIHPDPVPAGGDWETRQICV